LKKFDTNLAGRAIWARSDKMKLGETVKMIISDPTQEYAPKYD